VHRNNGKGRWILTEPHSFHQFGSDGNLEGSGRCSRHGDPSNQFVLERGQVQNSLANGVLRLSNGNSFGDELGSRITPLEMLLIFLYQKDYLIIIREVDSGLGTRPCATKEERNVLRVRRNLSLLS